ncbi:MAG: hypothetical protein JO112_21820 [Planctomycetes bacterium]|nr:hypothetical protein [Planctomycetota bacterium]
MSGPSNFQYNDRAREERASGCHFLPAAWWYFSLVTPEYTMSYPNLLPRISSLFRPAFLAFLLGGASLLLDPEQAPGAGGKSKPGTAARTTLGQSAAPPGALLRRESSEKPWQVLPVQETVTVGEQLMALSGREANITFQEGAVQLTLWGNAPGLAGPPVRESVVELQSHAGTDLAFQLLRGRVVVAKGQDQKPVHVRASFADAVYHLTLNDPGTEVALERFGRWPQGSPFVKVETGKTNPEKKAPVPSNSPRNTVVLVVLKGQADLKSGDLTFALHAPPGPAYFHWDNTDGAAPGPNRLDQIPPWATPEALQTAEAKVVLTAAARLSAELANQPVEKAVAAAVDRADPALRKLAVYDLAALDDVPRLVDALGDEKYADVRDTAVEAMQHWLGRRSGQDRKLYDFLVQQRQYTASQAEIVLQLLHGFSNEDRNRVEIYEALVAYLNSSRVPVRELAQWYLYQWVPGAGRDIPYDPAGPKEQRERAYQAWSKLLTEGKLPPRAPAQSGR